MVEVWIVSDLFPCGNQLSDLSHSEGYLGISEHLSQLASRAICLFLHLDLRCGLPKFLLYRFRRAQGRGREFGER